MIYGNEFRLDGELIPLTSPDSFVQSINVPEGSVLSGTLADGTPFAFSSLDYDRIEDNKLLLNFVALPDVGPPVFVLPNNPAPIGIRHGQTLVVDDGGILGDHFNAGKGSTTIVTSGKVGEDFEAVNSHVSIVGGQVGDHFAAFNKSNIEITGGSIGHAFAAHAGTSVEISGGSFGEFFAASTGTSINLEGGEFRLDGKLIEGLDNPGDSLPFNIPVGSVLSGILADGTPFAFANLVYFSGYDSQSSHLSLGDYDTIADGTLTLTTAPLPAIGPPVIVASTHSVPLGIRSGQTLIVDDDYIVPDSFNAGRGSSVIVTGGSIGDNLEAVGAHITLDGGTIGNVFDAFAGSTVDIIDGVVGFGFQAHSKSTVNVSGGNFKYLTSIDNSTLNISGGYFGSGFTAFNGSVINMSGGQLSYSKSIFSGSKLNISGDASISSCDVFDDSIVNMSGGKISGTLLVVDSTAIISGGIVGELGVSNAMATISSDAFVQRLLVSQESFANINGGTVGENSRAHHSSIVNISGGSIGGSFGAADNSTINISGGSIGEDFRANDSSTINIAGGTFGLAFYANHKSSVHLFGTQFIFDSIDITSLLTENVPFTIIDRDVELAGLFADGSPFDFDLNSINLSGEDYFDPGANLTITLIDPDTFDF